MNSDLLKKINLLLGIKMDAQKVDMYLIVNSKYFENHQLNILRERLTAMDESDWKY